MEGAADADRALSGEENSAVEGDGDQVAHYGMARCASQSSLDESSQRPGSAGGGDCERAAAADESARHAGALLEGLARLRDDEALCDVRLRARRDADSPPGPPLAAHRAVLAAASPYFRAMFTQFEESSRAEVTIQGVEPAALEALVRYVYEPGSLRVREDGVQALLSAASLLALGGARDACCAFLAAALAPDNALGIRAFAELHACAELARQAADYAEANFARVLATDEFLALEADALAALLRSDRLVVPGEEAVLDAVCAWVARDAPARTPCLGALLEHVRLPLLARDALVARAAAEPLAGAGADARVKDLVIEALSFHLVPAARRAAAAAGLARARPRAAAAAPAAALLVAGGQAPKAVRDAELLPLAGPPAWRAVAALPSRRCRAGMAAVDGRAYAVGGFNGTLRVRSVDVYDPATDSWSAGPALGARRSTLGVAALDGTLYAVGGFDGATGLSSAEALDVAAGASAWRPVAAMSTRRSSVGVAALDGKLYAVGGYDGAARQCLHTVERYDPVADRWEPAADMGARRSGCGVGAAGGALYAVGGHDGPAVRRSVERYSPAGARGSWAAAPSMHSARRNAAVAAHAGRLYAVGGDDGAANLDSVEVLEPGADAWTLLTAGMSLGRSYAAVCILERAPAPRTLCACAATMPRAARARHACHTEHDAHAAPAHD